MITTQQLDVIRPAWPAPPAVHAVITTRSGGFSVAPYASFNLADHVGDDRATVLRNRAHLREQLALPAEPCWLQQVHGVRVAHIGAGECGPVEADGAWTAHDNTVCAVLTADCLPAIFCDREATRVAVAHAGWRGLAAGVLENTLAALAVEADDLMVFLGPAIGPRAFVVGAEVRAAFVDAQADAAQAFYSAGDDRYFADLYLLARQRLARCGVTSIYGGGECTYTDRERFYSYRRDGVTGRFATLVWLQR